MTERLRTTPLHDEHLRLGGKMIDFAGFSLPVHYRSGIQTEHRAVREAAGLFDVSHMGEFEVSGPEALEFLQHLTVNDVEALAVGQAQYSLLCNPDGGVIDDLLVYRLGDISFLMVVNAATRMGDLDWLRMRLPEFDAILDDRSDQYSLLALQGPAAASVLGRVTDTRLEEIRPFHFLQSEVSGVQAIVARTGYTGEDGFEIYVEGDRAVRVWTELVEAGSPLGLRPAGLGARDLLRLEMGYPLYGADLDEEHTPLEAGLGWVVKLRKEEFIGRSALARQREEGVSRKLVGIQLSERGFPRPGYPVIEGGALVGSLTSGTMSPSVGSGIAMAYLPADLAHEGTALAIRIRERDLSASVVGLPFYREGSRKR